MNVMNYSVFQQYKNSSWHLPSGEPGGGGQTTGGRSQRNRLSDRGVLDALDSFSPGRVT